MNPKKPVCGIISVSLPLLGILLILSGALMNAVFHWKGMWVQGILMVGMLCMFLSVFFGMIIGGIGILRREKYRWLGGVGIGITLLLLPFFAALAVPAVTGAINQAQQIQAVQNGLSIHLATTMMLTDGKATGDKELGWPGDLKASGDIATLSDFVNLLVRHDYLRPEDLRIFSGSRFPAYKGEFKDGVLDPPFEDKNSVFQVYLVKEDDPADTVFLISKPGAFENAGFVIVYKDGSGRKYKMHQVEGLDLKFPDGATEENAENCLNPGL